MADRDTFAYCTQPLFHPAWAAPGEDGLEVALE